MPVRHPLNTITAALLLGVTLGLSACQDASPPKAPETSGTVAAPMAEGHEHQAAAQIKYICPMHPQIVRDAPGTCPICGMALVARTPKQQQSSPTIEVSGAIAQAMNIRSAQVKKGTLWRYIKTLGRVSYDETHLVHVHPRASGWIEGLKIAAEGDPVRQGQDLLELYSPDILDAQVNYLIALGPTPDQKERQDKAKNRLRLLDVPEDIIATISKVGESLRRIPIRSPQDGVITSLLIRDGMYVKPETELMTLADTSRLWVVADIYEHQIDWIRPGLEAEISTPALPGRTWKGRLEYIYPELDPKTRTLKVRIAFDNPDRLLKPNLFANVTIYGGPKKDILTLPREALILEADRSLVIRRLDDGRFRQVKVKTGMRTAEEVEILSGLKLGDEVVVSGQFLLDSEANIQASLNRLDSDLAARVNEGHAH